MIADTLVVEVVVDEKGLVQGKEVVVEEEEVVVKGMAN